MSEKSGLSAKLALLVDNGTIPLSDVFFFWKLSFDEQSDLADRIDTITYREYRELLAKAKTMRKKE